MTNGQSIDDLYRFGLKLFLEPGVSLRDADCIPIFHGWIRTAALDRLLIDVADYTHLHGGPSVLLVGHEGNLWVDRADGRPGIVCTSKQPAAGALTERVVGVARTLIVAAKLLESDPTLTGQLRFVSNELQFQSNDRMLAPPSDESVAALTPVLEATMESLYPGQAHEIARQPISTARLKINLSASQPLSLDSLLERITQTTQNA